MRKSVIGLIAVMAGVLLIGVNTGSALSITVTYTADNVVDAWYQNGSSPVSLTPGTNANNWRLADTATLTLDPGTSYEIVWQIENIGDAGDGNPGAFMAQISPADLLADSSLALSSAIWEVAVVYEGADPTLFWENAEEYGANDDPTTIWWKNNENSPVAGID